MLSTEEELGTSPGGDSGWASWPRDFTSFEVFVTLSSFSSLRGKETLQKSLLTEGIFTFIFLDDMKFFYPEDKTYIKLTMMKFKGKANIICNPIC